MSIITITLAGKNFRLSCSEESKAHIEKLSEKLDLELKETSKLNSSASFEMLLVMVSLGLIDAKYSKTKESAGEALEKAEEEHDEQLASLFKELKIVASKF